MRRSILSLVVIGLLVLVTTNISIAEEEMIKASTLEKILGTARIELKITRDTPWECLPIFIKERISRRHQATLLDKKDITELIAYYQGILKSWNEGTRGVSIRQDFTTKERLRRRR